MVSVDRQGNLGALEKRGAALLPAQGSVARCSHCMQHGAVAPDWGLGMASCLQAFSPPDIVTSNWSVTDRDWNSDAPKKKFLMDASWQPNTRRWWHWILPLEPRASSDLSLTLTRGRVSPSVHGGLRTCWYVCTEFIDLVTKVHVSLKADASEH